VIKKSLMAVAAASLVLSGTVGAQAARDYIFIVSSSTVYPFATVVAENFGRSTGFRTPKIETTGSGGGLQLFCSGIGIEHPDITNASRSIKSSEVELCASNGVTDIVDVKIGYDGIVLANDKAAPLFDLSLRDVWLALAKEVPNPSLVGRTLSVEIPASDDADMLMKGHIEREVPEDSRRLSDQQIAWMDVLIERGQVEKRFNTAFFTNGDSRDPEVAGILGAAKGSFYMLMVTLGLSFPIGVAAAVYLEEFAPQNRFTDLIEININNLAAVPFIVFGLLGLAVFLNFFGMPRSAPLVGGLVLTLMTLPTIIISSRAALKSVPPSIREAALGMGASKMQTTFHHVVPLAMPGMLTGTIIGMAQALGESAPLLMIGMIAFVVDVPQGFLDPSTVLPVQIFLWADSPERAFLERTSAGIMVLLAFLILMNLVAILLRRRFERRW
jgi:phosphate transport system permease protein